MDLSELQADYLQKLRKVTVDKLQIGALILTELSVDDGLDLKNRTHKPKRLIIIGVDLQNDVCYGSVLVNTDMSPKASYSPEFLSAQYLLKAETYPDFLDYDSFVDCGKLFSIPISKLIVGEHYGLLTKEDKNGIFNILETTDIYSTKEKKRYGIKRR